MRQLKRESRRTGPSIVIAAWTLGLAACSGESTDASVARVHGDLSANPANVAAPSSSASCDPLLAELRDHLLSQVVERAEQARALSTPEDAGIFSDPASSARAGASRGSIVIPGPDAPSAAKAPVRDIDRGDIVKTDADLIYLLHGSVLFVLDAEPAAATEVLATAAIEGQPLALVVNDRRVVVFSAVSPTASESGDESSTYTKLTVFDVGGGTLETLREFYVEGVYNSARIDGDLVRAVLTQAPKPQLDTPAVSYADVFGHPRTPAEIDLQVDIWALLTTESIEDSTIGDYVPSIVERVGGTLVRQPPSCDDYLLPEEVPAEPRLTTVITLDLGTASTPLGNFKAFGDVGVFDAGPGAIIFTQTERVNGDDTRPLVKTNLQRLSLGEHTTSGAARVAGSILNIDESNGVVRVLTIQNRYTEDATSEGGDAYAGPSIRVVTLAADTMTQLGQSADLTGDGYVSNSYFSGDRAYLVTAGQATGLSVLDLSDAAAPAAVGQVHTTNGIFQLHALAPHALLGLGQTADPSLGVQNVALQLFDVSDASAPRLAHELMFDEPGYTDALYGRDVLGINSTRDAIALPFQSYVTGVSSLKAFGVSLSVGFVRLGGVVPPATDPTLHECLELLGYPTDPEYQAQIEQDPSLADGLLESCRSYYETDDVRRGLFRGDALFAIGERRVTAYAVDALTEPPLSQVDLDSSCPTTSP